MKALLVLVLLVAGVIVWGANTVWTGIQHVTPVTCADFVGRDPDARWLRVSECETDWVNVRRQNDTHGQLDAVYTPLRPRGVTSGPAHLVLEGDTEDDIRAAHGVYQGMLRTGFFTDASDEYKAGLAREINLAPSFQILRLGDEPHFVLGIVALAGGLGIVAGAFWLWRRSRRAA